MSPSRELVLEGLDAAIPQERWMGELAVKAMARGGGRFVGNLSNSVRAAMTHFSNESLGGVVARAGPAGRPGAD